MIFIDVGKLYCSTSVVFTEHLLFQIVEFISVLLTVGSEAAEEKLIDFGAVQRIINLFFEYVQHFCYLVLKSFDLMP